MPQIKSKAQQARADGGFERYVARTDRSLLLLAVAFLGLLLLPVLEPDLSPRVRTALAVGNGIVWLVFALDYATRLYLALDRRSFVRRNVLDLVIVLVPMLRPLRVVRGVRALRVLRLAGLSRTAAARSRRRLLGQVAAYAAVVVALTAVTGAVAVLELERGAEGANITSLGDALWWAATTLTTVGYGDRFPVTGGGRVVAVLLMLGGIALLGVVTAAVASAFLRHAAEGDERSAPEADAASSDSGAAILAALTDLSRRLELLEQRIEGSPAAIRRPSH